MRKLLVVLALAVTALPLSAEPCYACSCAGPSEGEEREWRHRAAREADVVFTGRVWRIEGNYAEGSRIKAHFFVEDAYKGTYRHRLVISTPSQGSACGFFFKRGARYTVFGYGEGPRLYSTHNCSESQRGRINPDRYGL